MFNEVPLANQACTPNGSIVPEVMDNLSIEEPQFLNFNSHDKILQTAKTDNFRTIAESTKKSFESIQNKFDHFSKAKMGIGLNKIGQAYTFGETIKDGLDVTGGVKNGDDIFKVAKNLFKVGLNMAELGALDSLKKSQQKEAAYKESVKDKMLGDMDEDEGPEESEDMNKPMGYSQFMNM